jgi:hypothetical protein
MSEDPARTTRVLAAATTVLVALGLSGCGSKATSPPSAARVDRRMFTTKIDNSWLPLRPGTTLTYEGVKEGKPQRDVVAVTQRTRTVDGVRCVVVDDRVSSGGRPSERTADYYAQDRGGDVWYFGEDTAELDARGRVTSTEGTWHAGVDGARAGLVMPADPHLGEHHYQEYYRGHAEDQFKVVALRAHVEVPYGDYRDALQTQEWTRLEPDVLDAKYYVRGIGQVFEGSRKGPREYAKLVSVKRA